VNYTVDISHPTEYAVQSNGDIELILSYHATFPDNATEDGIMTLTIRRTENGYLIRDMSPQLASSLKRYTIEQARKNSPPVASKYDSLLAIIIDKARALQKHYDSVVYYTEVNDQTLFYVVKGTWESPYESEKEKQRDGGNYKMGVVTEENKVIIPVAYSKIYNPDGSFEGMIEVENDSKRGLFRTNGEVFLPAEYDGIYPTKVPGAFAQLKKGESYGWIDDNGKISFDASSHENKTLFQSPVESHAILQWDFKYPGKIKLLLEPHEEIDPANGLIIYPSYIRDLGVTPIGNGFIYLETSEWGMGVQDTKISFEQVDSFSDKFFALVSFFMESGADAREFHTANNDLVVVDKDLKRVGYQEKITDEQGGQDPCSGYESTYRTIAPGLYESEDGDGNYSYFKITSEGSVEKLKTDRQYNFTKFAKIDEHYFKHCSYESIGVDKGDVYLNVVVLKGLSSEELDLMRNEIFAEYGFIFKSEKWKKYFESKPWYKPQYENVDQFLTEIDKANIKFILEYQKAHKDLQIQRDSINYPWAG
jgi:hypothetical protein